MGEERIEGIGDTHATLQAISRAALSQWANRRGLTVGDADLDDLLGTTPRGPLSAQGNQEKGLDDRNVPAAEQSLALTRTTSRTIETILNAATKIFLKQGFNANVNDIAGEAGVTKPTIYSHFKSKRELFIAAITKMSQELVPRMPIGGTTDNLFDDLISYARVYRTISLRDSSLELFRLLLSNIPSIPRLGHDVGAIVMPEMTNSLSAYFARAIENGKIRPVNPQFLALQFFAIADGHARTWKLLGLQSPQRDSEAYLRQSIECFVRGIQP